VRSLQESQKKLLHNVFKKSFHPSFAFYNQYFDFEVFEKMEQEIFMKALLKVLKKYVSQTLEPNQDVTLEITAEALFQKLPSFEARENQKKMAAMVESSLFDNKKMVIEAPTGVGKTFAYLIPSLLYSVKF
jgi:CRISPR/Cas system-associated endonuclease/helicase Cas3